MSARTWTVAFTMALIAVATLLPTDSSAGGNSLCLFCDIRSLADFVSNIVLFAPFGAAMTLRGASVWQIVLSGAVFSGLIEGIQIDLVAGRNASLGDLVANTLGAALGWLIGRLRPWRAARSFGLRDSLLITALTCAGLLTGLVLLRPVLPPPPYYLFWTPDYENQGLYLGRVIGTRLGPLEWQQDYQSMEPGETARRLLQSEPLEVRFLAGPPPDEISPILAIQTRELEIIFMGAVGSDFIYRYWGAADVARLDHGDLRIPNVLDGLLAGDTVNLGFSFGTRGYCIVLNGEPRCGGGFAVGDTWTILVSPDWSAATFQTVAFAWLFLAFLPGGYVSSDKRRLAMMIGGAVLCLLAAPLALGFAGTPLYQLLGVVSGFGAGYAGSGVYRHLAARRIG